MSSRQGLGRDKNGELLQGAEAKFDFSLLQTKHPLPTGRTMTKEKLEWCNTRVIVDDATTDLFEMPGPNEDPDQEPTFRVTRSTAALVKRDFERYRPSLERMVVDWREKKELFMQETNANVERGTDDA